MVIPIPFLGVMLVSKYVISFVKDYLVEKAVPDVQNDK